MIGSAPRHLVVRHDGLVACPGGGVQPYGDCFACPALQGTLDGMGLVMLCGHGVTAPPLRFAGAGPVRTQAGASQAP